MIVKLPQLAWHDTSELDIFFPDTWQVEECHMFGYNRPALSPPQIEKIVTNPIGMPPISEAARGKKEIVIVFDDMSRVTRTAEIVPYVLEELARAGIADSQIRFVSALGCHGPMTRPDFIKKLGESVVTRFHIFNHNIFGNCTHIGTTSLGTELYVNSEVAKCDFKIAIGSIVPHGFAGFGGGSKIILPGISSLETARQLHSMKQTQHGGVDFTGMGCIDNNPLSRNIGESAGLLGLDIKIDAILNMWGQTVSLYAGSPIEAFNAGVEEAKQHYLTPRAKGCDVFVTNTFAKANEGEGGIISGIPSVRTNGGDLVLICNAPDGHVAHYLLGNWGNISNDPFRLQVKLPPQINRLIVLNEYPDLSITGYFTPQEKVTVVDKWETVIEMLQQTHGDVAKVAVYSSAEIQYCSGQ